MAPKGKRKNVPHFTCVAALVREVMREDVLQPGWQDNLVRAQAWIPRWPGIAPVELDAFTYRQSLDGGLLHICDTRSTLTIAFYIPGDGDFRQTPRKILEEITPRLLKIPIPEKWIGVRTATGDRIMIAQGVQNMPEADTPATSKTEWGAPNPKESTYGFSCSLGERLVVYGFQKLAVPGCNLDPKMPLFRSASTKPTQVEEAITFFQGMKDPKPADISGLVRVLKSLPALEPRDQRDHPYDFRLLSEAKYNGYDKLIAAVTSASKPEEVRLVMQALEALPKEPDLHAKAWQIQQAALESLRKIRTPEALEGLTKIAGDAVTPDIFERSTMSVLRAMPEADARRVALEQVQAMAANPDADPDKLLVYMRALGPQERPPQVRLIGEILQKTKNENVRTECFRVLAQWITGTMDVRDEALRTLKDNVSDANPRVRSTAALAFGRSRDVRFLTLLAPMLDDADAGVRRMAGEATCFLLGWDMKQAADTAALKARLAPVLEALKALDASAREGAQKKEQAPRP